MDLRYDVIITNATHCQPVPYAPAFPVESGLTGKIYDDTKRIPYLINF